MQYKSKETSVELLKKLFSGTQNSSSITLEQIYITSGRDLSKPKENRKWITNMMTHLKHHKLVDSDYGVKNKLRVLKGYKLSSEGKRALNPDHVETTSRSWSPQQETTTNTSSSIEVGASLYKLFHEVAKFKEVNQEYEVTFDVKLKGANT